MAPPEKIRFVICGRAEKALGIEFPNSILVQATKVIGEGASVRFATILNRAALD